MRGFARRVAGAAIALVVAAAVSGQSVGVDVALADGTVATALEIVGDADGELELLVGRTRRRVPASTVVALSGGAVQRVELPTAYLAGGDLVRGALAGGDASGDRLDLLSPVLGPIDLRVDRLLAFTANRQVNLAALHLPEGVDEALFQRASFGYDVIAGSLHQFGEKGVRFQPTDGAPRWFSLTEFVALRLEGAGPRATPATATVFTRTGDRVSVVVRKFTGTTIQCEREGGAPVELRFVDLAALTFAGTAVFASDLEPRTVAESGFDGDVVHPWRRDESAIGGPLLVGGRSFGKGLGVHARSKLEFVVPENAVQFWTRVGIDDTAAETGVTATVDVRVLVDDKVAFERKGLALGVLADSGVLAVRSGGRVALEVDFGAGRDIGDRVDWLVPVFLPAKGRPR